MEFISGRKRGSSGNLRSQSFCRLRANARSSRLYIICFFCFFFISYERQRGHGCFPRLFRDQAGSGRRLALCEIAGKAPRKLLSRRSAGRSVLAWLFVNGNDDEGSLRVELWIAAWSQLADLLELDEEGDFSESSWLPRNNFFLPWELLFCLTLFFESCLWVEILLFLTYRS